MRDYIEGDFHIASQNRFIKIKRWEEKRRRREERRNKRLLKGLGKYQGKNL